MASQSRGASLCSRSLSSTGAHGQSRPPDATGATGLRRSLARVSENGRSPPYVRRQPGGWGDGRTCRRPPSVGRPDRFRRASPIPPSIGRSPPAVPVPRSKHRTPAAACLTSRPGSTATRKKGGPSSSLGPRSSRLVLGAGVRGRQMGSAVLRGLGVWLVVLGQARRGRTPRGGRRGRRSSRLAHR